MKKAISLLLALALLFALCACGAPAEPAEPAEPAAPSAPTEPQTPDTPDTPAQPEPVSVTVTDMIGRELELIPGSYKRVVCIGAGALRMYSYIGDTALLCGVEDIDNPTLDNRPKMFDSVARPYLIAYGDVFSALPSCGVGGPNAQAAEAEMILSCNPDIVISEYEDTEKANALQEQLGIPVVTLRSGKDSVFDEAFKDSMTLLGQIFAKEDRAAELISFIEAQAAEISIRTADIAEEDKPGVYICGLGNWGTTNHLMTAGDYVSFRIANIKNVAVGLTAEGIQPIEAEKFTALGNEIDVMIMDAAAVKNIAPLYAEDPALFDGCKAWESGEVYLQMAYNAYYTNYETALINTWFNAKSVYPALFEDIDMAEKTNEICEMFLGQAMADEIFAHPSSFGGYQKLDTATFFE